MTKGKSVAAALGLAALGWFIVYAVGVTVVIAVNDNEFEPGSPGVNMVVLSAFVTAISVGRVTYKRLRVRSSTRPGN